MDALRQAGYGRLTLVGSATEIPVRYLGNLPPGPRLPPVPVLVRHDPRLGGHADRAAYRARRERAVVPETHRHRHLLTIVRLGPLADGGWYVSTPWRPDGDLANTDPMPWDRVLPIGLALADALEHVHRAGVVHGDLGPHWVVRHGDDVELAGFAVPRKSFVEQLGPEQVAPSYPWSPPEQRLTPASDVYGLGQLLHLLLGGRPGSDSARFPGDTHRAPPGPTMFERLGVPGPAAAVLARAVHPVAVDRQQTAAEFGAALAEAADRTPGQTPVVPVEAAHWPTHRRYQTLSVELPFGWQTHDRLDAEPVYRCASLAAQARPREAPAVDTVVEHSDETAGGYRQPQRRLTVVPVPERVLHVLARCAETEWPYAGAAVDESLAGVRVDPPVLSAGGDDTFRRRGGLSLPVPEGWPVREELTAFDPDDRLRLSVRTETLHTGPPDVDGAEREIATRGQFRRAYVQRTREILATDLGPALLHCYDWQPSMSGPVTSVNVVWLLGPDSALFGEARVEQGADLDVTTVVDILASLRVEPDPLPDRSPSPPPPTGDVVASSVREFVDAAVAVCPPVPARTLPPEMWAGEIGRDGAVRWRPGTSTVDAEELERRLGAPAPASYRQLVLARRLGEVRHDGVHVPAFDWEVLRGFERWLRGGLLPVATVDAEMWCYDLATRDPLGDCPIVSATAAGRAPRFAEAWRMFGHLAARLRGGPVDGRKAEAGDPNG